MLADGDELRSRSDAADQRARTIVGLQCQDRLDFAVLRKRLRARKKNRAPISIHAVVALLSRAQPIGDAMLIAQKEIGAVDGNDIAFALLHFESPKHGPRERVFDRAALVWIIAQRTKTRVLLDQQNLGADTLEANEMRLAHFAAIEADRIRSHTRWQ